MACFYGFSGKAQANLSRFRAYLLIIKYKYLCCKQLS